MDREGIRVTVEDRVEGRPETFEADTVLLSARRPGRGGSIGFLAGDMDESDMMQLVMVGIATAVQIACDGNPEKERAALSRITLLLEQMKLKGIEYGVLFNGMQGLDG